MVLSRKKLKQKFRSLITESLAASEPKDSRKSALGSEEVEKELQSIRELLLTKSRKPKRGKRKKSKNLPEELENGDGRLEIREANMDITDNREKEHFVDLKEKGKNKKRKRGDNAGKELEDGLQKDEKKLEKRKKDKKKKEKKKRREMKLKKKCKDGKEGQEEGSFGDTIKSANDECKIAEVTPPVQVDESEKKRVYVGGIPYYSSEDDIISFFQDCGTVTEMDCMTFPETGKFRGIAILTFKTEGSAKRALALDGADMGGFYLKIQPYRATRNQRPDFAPEIIDGYHRAYVGNLSWDISEDDLKQLFSDCKVSSVRLGTDKETGDFKGYAHVDFADSVSLAIAMKLDQSVLCGRPVRIRCAVPRKSVPGESSSGGSTVRKLSGSQVGVGSGANAEANAGGQKSKRKKRQTCYECGTPGHLSSECPRKGVAAERVAAS